LQTGGLVVIYRQSVIHWSNPKLVSDPFLVKLCAAETGCLNPVKPASMLVSLVKPGILKNTNKKVKTRKKNCY